jgi:hypothetical protein
MGKLKELVRTVLSVGIKNPSRAPTNMTRRRDRSKSGAESRNADPITARKVRAPIHVKTYPARKTYIQVSTGPKNNTLFKPPTTRAIPERQSK